MSFTSGPVRIVPCNVSVICEVSMRPPPDLSAIKPRELFDVLPVDVTLLSGELQAIA